MTNSYFVDSHLSYPFYLSDIAGLYFALFTNDFRLRDVAGGLYHVDCAVWCRFFNCWSFERVRNCQLPHTLRALSATLP